MASSSSREQEHIDGRRARELYRYFQPQRSLSADRIPTPSTIDSDSVQLGVPPARESALATPPSPALSAQHAATTAGLVPEALILGEYNATLSSFAQLAALRLDVERVMISVSDRTSQFIIAQSSKSLLGGKRQYEYDGSGTWDGCHTHTSAAWPMCRKTVNLPPSNRERGEYSFLEVNDLSRDDRYKDIPFVKDDPHFKFYAGTPLTTETPRINIGCLFLLDTNPHNGLTEAEKEIMGSISVLIMNFLKVSRQASEGRRAARLSRGLSCFVEGSSSFVDTANHSSTGSISGLPSSPPCSAPRGNHLSVRSSNSLEGLLKRSHSSDARSFSSLSDYKIDLTRSSNPTTNPPTPLPEWWSGTQRRELEGLDQSHSNCWAFKRAANLLRESLELDGDGGVVFLEIGTTPAVDIDSGSDYSTAENVSPASILAMSTNEEPFAPSPGSTVASPAANLDTAFLQQLIRRYSKGKLWSFHRDGSVSGSDDENAKSSKTSSRTAKTQDLTKGAPKRWRSVENSLLNTYFPNATQVLFVPLWNAASSQWFAGCFCWNTVESRVFSSSVELSSVLGFGSSIMVEHSRLESLISDRQKGDFIGSISHELRSPLHGILAAAEFLSGTELDEFQGSLLDTINACSVTLLDTMNQVLDFSKIVSLERKTRQLKRKTKQLPAEADDKPSVGLDTFVATDLALLAEEVVEGVCLGHAYSLKSSSNPMSPITEIPKTGQDGRPGAEMGVEVFVAVAQNNWIYDTQPGALRRIIMNVFGNAMKYTEAGSVCVRLEAAESPDGRRSQPAEDLVTLTVSDTGKGISEEFLRGRLYTPFAQEDTLAVGTGLGLSIVRSLVKTLGGSIDVHSRPGEGTTVRVTMPLARPGDDVDVLAPNTADSQIVRSTSEKDSADDCDILRRNHPKKQAAILGMDPVDAGTHPLWSSVMNYLTKWYNYELVSWGSELPIDVVLADEHILAEYSPPASTATSLPPLVIICSRSIDYMTARSRWSSLADIVSIITRPCGPYKLARTIQRCFDSQKEPVSEQHVKNLPIRQKATLLSDANAMPEKKPKTFEDLNDTPDLTDAASSTTPGSISSDRSTPSQASSEVADPISTLTPSCQLQSPPVTKLAAKQGRTPRVLVVDDNFINLNLMLTFLKRRRLETLESAENGQLAVDAVERTPGGFDLIFMDISMPVMNGFEATRAIRAIEKERGTEVSTPATIIALTGLSSSRDESEALSSGIDLFLTKPVSFKEVSKLLDGWIAKTVV
ncbi:putative sensor histidine kinase/response regulator [Aspergillus mulundensis]|uniref:histidine kinase n=1 Tax=Aspergillus mulundensis TaxID=1810919 RepID=A0A3D8SIS2_9EURO|nr:hypothetical protein DSM5745_02877 [Aspergillus mulundensis]RDW86235.1 hypothetical protein DSM5745_02877 [Aspergillus mulundensis]